MRPTALDGRDEGFDEVVVLLPADAMVLPADIDGVVEQGLVIGAHVEQDGQAVLRGNAAESGIESHFADRNANAAGALIAEAEDALAVADHDAAHIVIARVGEHLLHAMLVGIADKEATGPAPDFAEALAAFAHRGGVDDGQQFLNIVRNEGVEEGLVVVLQIAHVAVLAERGGAAVKDPLAAFALVFESPDVGREQAMECEGIALFFSEGGTLVEAGIQQQFVAGKAGTNCCRMDRLGRRRFCTHSKILL